MNSGDPFPWKKRAEERAKLIMDYVNRFKTISTIYTEAERNGYDLALLQYITAVADVQAQMIIPEQSGIGWNGVTIFGVNTPITDGMKKQFFTEQKRQAETGMIDVAIPTGRIEAMKAMAEYWKQRGSEYGTPTPKQTELPVEKTALDIEIDRQFALRTAV